MDLLVVVLALYAIGFICSIRGAFGAWARNLPEVRRARLAHRIDEELRSWVKNEKDEEHRRSKQSEYEQLKRSYCLDGGGTLGGYVDQTMFGYNPGSAEVTLGRHKEQNRDLPYIGVGAVAGTAGSALSLLL